MPRRKSKKPEQFQVGRLLLVVCHLPFICLNNKPSELEVITAARVTERRGWVS